ncbi:urea ABC transporter substrate-binding protein [Actinomadura barringtoniae]|uniref:Urea ABC transporter substrate-binding protein n=1 Tax=Actinomadura barringtoniae TaxID=1427535 RepID=A0A939T5V0_9ACTN|nr:urea ABC transporter substrate-binding protein [Actinomadura barringtoniae]MBO2451058.1 urea ABC transporter substrate-binding protein [Actinomadura barringtoniae]
MMRRAHRAYRRMGVLNVPRAAVLVIACALAAVLAAGLLEAGYAGAQRVTLPPIKVGVLHSLTGSVAIAERPINDATLLAIEEINAHGGLLGRKIQPVVVDGRSDWPTFAALARRLLSHDRAAAIFGCYTSASRRTVEPIIERLHGALFYPTFYEGMESSPNVVYTGSAPNQFITPAVKWFLDNRGKRFYLVGSDYVYPRSSNAIIKDQLARLGGQVVGEAYVPLGASDVRGLVRKIVKARPQVIISSIVGDTNLPFYRALREAGATPQRLPVLSIVMAEAEMQFLRPAEMAGNYIAMSYFQSVGGASNEDFVRRFKRRFGAGSVISDPMQSAYESVQLWAQAVRRAHNVEPSEVLKAIRGQSFDAPEGRIWVDEENLHAWKRARIGQIRADGQVDIIWESETVLHPVPYPPSRTRRDWNGMLHDLYTGWHNSWARP